MDRTYYADKTLEMLNASQTYEEITANKDKDVMKLKELAGNHSHNLTEAMEYWIDKHPGSLNSRFTKEFIIDSILLILTNNTFTFDDRIFLQKKGTTMGTKMAPSYATLLLGYMENESNSQVSNKMGEEIGHYVYTNWRRFLDDCYINCPYGEDKLKELHDILNTVDGSIQLTAETSCKELPFLDVMIGKDNTHLTTDVYCKPTDSFQYLPYTSSHPRHTKNNIPYNLARGIQLFRQRLSHKI